MKTTCIILLLAGYLAAQEAPPLPQKVEPYPVVADIWFAEGPTFNSKGNLYFVNYIRQGTIGRKTPDGTVSVWVDLATVNGTANGLKADAHDNIIAADLKGKRLLRISPDHKIEVLADSYDGKPFLGLNDVALDKAGNIYFTDPFGSSKDKPIGGVCRYSIQQRRVKCVDRTLAFPNGVAVSPDQKRLYVTETLTSRVVVYNISPDGKASNRRILYQWESGSLDGIGFDEYSRLWVTRPDAGVVDVVTESGQLVGSIPSGGHLVTNITWWKNSVYLTVAGPRVESLGHRAGTINRLDVGVGPAK